MHDCSIHLLSIMYRYHTLGIIVLFIALWSWVAPSQTLHAATPCNTDNTICIDSQLAPFWAQQGGLTIFGQPLAPSTTTTVDGATITTQQFERARLEYHPTNTAPYTILLGLLGTQSLSGVDVNALTAVAAPHTTNPATTCKSFAGTPYQACGDFLNYWHKHGLQQDRNPKISEAESLALFGIPLTPPYMRVMNGESFVVQVFERARMEYHHNNPPAYRIQLGLLGSELQAAPSTTTNQPAPTTTATVAVLPQSILESFRAHMPYTGYWEHSSDGIYVAVGGFKYLKEFFGAPAPDGQRYVAMSVTIANMREPSAASIYVDRTYFQLTDIDGNPPQSALSNSTDLKTEFIAQTVAPGARMGGQLIFLIHNKYGVPAQLQVTVANMDTYLTRSSQTVEFRVWPLGAYQEPTK
jgi:hypothetical protein